MHVNIYNYYFISSVASPPTLQMTRNDKQLQAVLERQKAYKLAASKALKEGDKDAARGYLKIAKGMDPMIEAAKSGLPIDLKSVILLRKFDAVNQTKTSKNY